MIIRRGEISDLQSIINIEKTVYNKPYWKENMLKKLFNENLTETAWVLQKKEKIIGFLIEQRCDDEISLLNVAVDRQFQNKGIGKRFIRQYLGIIPDNCSVFLEVNRNNFIARKIYLDLNFKNIGFRKNYYNDDGDALIMNYIK